MLEQFKKALKKCSHSDDLCEVIQELDWDSKYAISAKPLVLEINELGFKLSHESTHGGGEGGGEEYFVIAKLTHGDNVTYLKFYGWYSSYEGRALSGEYDEVEQQPVTRMEWVAK